MSEAEDKRMADRIRAAFAEVTDAVGEATHHGLEVEFSHLEHDRPGARGSVPIFDVKVSRTID